MKQTSFPLVSLCLAFLLAMAALLFTLPPLYQFIFYIASFLLSAYPVASACFKELAARGTLNGMLLLLTGCILCFLCRSYSAAAFSMLFYRIGQLLLSSLFQRLCGKLDKERRLYPLSPFISGLSETAYLPDGFIRSCQHWICYFIPIFASVCAVVSVVLGKVSVSEAVRRSAAMFLLGGGATLCAAFPLCDYVSVLLSANDGILFSEGALEKLYAARTLCADLKEPQIIGSAAVYSVDPSLYSAKMMVQLASLVWGDSSNPIASALSELCFTLPDLGLVQRRRELSGFGSVAMIQNNIVVCGNAKMMHRIDFPIVPFLHDDSTLHLSVEDTYLGCICLNHTFSDPALWAKLRQDNHLFTVSDKDSVSVHRLPEDKLLVFSSGPRHLPAMEEDCYVTLGGYGTDADIAVSDCGRGGAVFVLRCLKAARKRRCKSFSLVFAVKLLLLLLSLSGCLPVVVCVPVECLATALSYCLAVS